MDQPPRQTSGPNPFQSDSANQILLSKTDQVERKRDYGPLVQTNLTLKIIHRVVKLILQGCLWLVIRWRACRQVYRPCDTRCLWLTTGWRPCRTRGRQVYTVPGQQMGPNPPSSTPTSAARKTSESCQCFCLRCLRTSVFEIKLEMKVFSMKSYIMFAWTCSSVYVRIHAWEFDTRLCV